MLAGLRPASPLPGLRMLTRGPSPRTPTAWADASRLGWAGHRLSAGPYGPDWRQRPGPGWSPAERPEPTSAPVDASGSGQAGHRLSAPDCYGWHRNRRAPG